MKRIKWKSARIQIVNKVWIVPRYFEILGGERVARWLFLEFRFDLK